MSQYASMQIIIDNKLIITLNTHNVLAFWSETLERCNANIILLICAVSWPKNKMYIARFKSLCAWIWTYKPCKYRCLGSSLCVSKDKWTWKENYNIRNVLNVRRWPPCADFCWVNWTPVSRQILPYLLFWWWWWIMLFKRHFVLKTP